MLREVIKIEQLIEYYGYYNSRDSLLTPPQSRLVTVYLDVSGT